MWRAAANLRRLSSSSFASSGRRRRAPTNPFPYPTHLNPTPHQIFHLPYLASQDDIKARYYDLVRIHHPDSPVVRALGLTPEVAHARFQSISAAYDILRGRGSSSQTSQASDLDNAHAAAAAAATTAARRGAHASRPDLRIVGDERWKDRVIMGALVLAVGLFIVQTASMRFQVLAAKKKKDESTRLSPVNEEHQSL